MTHCVTVSLTLHVRPSPLVFTKMGALAVQGWLLHAVCFVLPDSACRPYARAAERWKLTAAAVRCLRLALCAAYAYGRHRQSAKDLGTAVLRTLGHDGAIAGYLLPALPPSAGLLRRRQLMAWPASNLELLMSQTLEQACCLFHGVSVAQSAAVVTLYVELYPEENH